MWVATPSGFYSAVAHRTKPKHMMIRARARQDLVNLIDVVRAANGQPTHADGALVEPVRPGLLPKERDIVATDFTETGGDYPFRITMLRTLWAAALEEFERRIDYDNFKNAVAKVDRVRAHTYHGVWASLLRIETERQSVVSPRVGYDRWEDADDFDIEDIDEDDGIDHREEDADRARDYYDQSPQGR